MIHETLPLGSSLRSQRGARTFLKIVVSISTFTSTLYSALYSFKPISFTQLIENLQGIV